MENDRILLRPWTDSDAPALFKYASDPDVGPRAGWPPHKIRSTTGIRSLISGHSSPNMLKKYIKADQLEVVDKILNKYNYFD